MNSSSDRLWVVLLAAAVEGGMIVVAELLGQLLGRPPRTLFIWNLDGVIWGLAATVPMVLLFVAMLRWPIGPLAKIKQFTQEVLCPLLAPCTVTDLLGISLLAGLGEEMLFRGVLQGSLQDKIGVWPALLAISCLFGVLHAITFSYAVFATLMGVYLGLLWLWADNLLAPALAHALYDFLALVYLLHGYQPIAAATSPPPEQDSASAHGGDG